MYFLQFASRGLQQQRWLISHPVDVHALSGNTLHRHRNGCLTIVLSEKRPVQLIKLGELVSVRVLLFVLQPQEGEVRVLHSCHTCVDLEIIRLGLCGSPQVFRRVERLLYVLWRHGFQFLQ